jgi:hypothetical protein
MEGVSPEFDGGETMFKPIRAGGWKLTNPVALRIVLGARGGRDYWYLDRTNPGRDTGYVIIPAGDG